MKSRLFISLNLPDKVVEKIISLRDTVKADENVKWEPREKLHLTIKFIGDVSNETVDKISNELLFINNYSSIKCSFNKFGFFYLDDTPIQARSLGYGSQNAFPALFDLERVEVLRGP